MDKTAIEQSIFREDERAIFALRSLYRRYGYTRYALGKFEEYELYVRNKNFLVSDSVITFTDADGKLMALKPDVTLSIIKNTDVTEGVKKLYYNETVYRPSKSSGMYREIMQTGLECMGEIDSYLIYEVILLAAKSLESISEKFSLVISHLGIVSAIMEEAGAVGDVSSELLRCIGEKNAHEIEEICKREGLDGNKLKRLASLYGSPDKVEREVRELSRGGRAEDYAETLISVVRAVEDAGYKGKIQIDFSVTGDTRYYNAFVLKGYIDKIPSAVLSGGQYDPLMRKMKKNGSAIGFAVYLDLLEELERTSSSHDCSESIILYDGESDFDVLRKAAKECREKEPARVVKCHDAKVCRPDGGKYRRVIRVVGREVIKDDGNA